LGICKKGTLEMKYVSIDIETTGLNPEKHQTLEIAAIIEDTTSLLGFEEIPKFRVLLYHEEIFGSLEAVNMNSNLLLEMSRASLCMPSNTYSKFQDFLVENEVDTPVIVAGKNFQGFDKKFLEKISWDVSTFSRRVLDPAILFTDWKNDRDLPSLAECHIRAGLGKISNEHSALHDAYNVIMCIRYGTRIYKTWGKT
jgi:oligoribonuclease (3'-5' exoribonuclease)